MSPALRSSAALALALVLGLAAGAWGMRLYFERTLQRWDPQQRLVLELGQDLDLDADQRARVALVLTEARARMEARRQAWRMDVRGLAREGEDQISRLLKPSQLDRFASLHDSIHGRMDSFLWASQEGPTALAITGPSR